MSNVLTTSHVAQSVTVESKALALSLALCTQLPTLWLWTAISLQVTVTAQRVSQAGPLLAFFLAPSRRPLASSLPPLPVSARQAQTKLAMDLDISPPITSSSSLPPDLRFFFFPLLARLSRIASALFLSVDRSGTSSSMSSSYSSELSPSSSPLSPVS